MLVDVRFNRPGGFPGLRDHHDDGLPMVNPQTGLHCHGSLLRSCGSPSNGRSFFLHQTGPGQNFAALSASVSPIRPSRRTLRTSNVGIMPRRRSPQEPMRRSRPRARRGSARAAPGRTGYHARSTAAGYRASVLEETRLTKSNPTPPTANEPPLAYRDDEFLDSDEGRPLRILSEYLQPLRSFKKQRVHDTIVFFGSARLREDGPMGSCYAEARELARLITEWSKQLGSPAGRFLICSGGGGGIMEAANRGAVEAGGRTIGLNIGLPHEQRPNRYITPGLCFQFHYFFMRKLWFAHLARAIVAFPGGFGTLDEIFEILTLAQTQKLDRRILVLLYGSSYW